MSESNVALDLLINAVLKQHRENLKDPMSDKDHTSIFTEEEMKSIVEALWQDRYSATRTNFQRIVGTLISEKVNNA
jgi:hypothetical protein